MNKHFCITNKRFIVVISLAIVCCFSVCNAAKPASGKNIPKIIFKNETKSSNLDTLLKAVHGHALAWGDINNDGYPDLFVGAFANHEDTTYAYRGHPAQPVSNKLLINNKGKCFTEVSPSDTEVYGVCSGAAFADFDNDGYLDLVVSHLSVSLSDKPRNWVANETINQSHKIYRNDGTGKFSDVTEKSNLIFNKDGSPSSARNTFILDYDGDGMLDILIQEDDLWPWSMGISRLMRNKGNFVFEDVTEQAGLPKHFYGLGGFVGDINGDTWPDIFFAHVSEMYINNQDGTFRKLNQNFIDEPLKATLDDGNKMWTCGAATGDLNGDGLIDFIMGEHYNENAIPHKIFVFINKGNDENNNPVFEDVTDRVGIKEALHKQPHVEIEDLNNDGKMDILVSSGEAFVYTNIENDENGLPQFMGPSSAETPKNRLGYWPAGATVDYNRDGSLDFAGVEWYSSDESPLLKNVTKNASNYLTVGFNIESEKNRNAIGATVELYKPGMLGMKQGLIGKKVVSISDGYNSGKTSEVHFGTKGFKKVDMMVKMPCDGNVYKLRNIRTKQHLIVTNNQEKRCVVENYSLNRISPYYDGQWQGITVTPDGKCYFGSSSHNLIHGGGFFKFDPAKRKVEVLAKDLTELVGDDITKHTPQGKIHSPIIKAGSELFMATHLAAYWNEVLDKYAGSYLLSYDISSNKWNNYGIVKDGFSTYSAIEVDEKRGKVYTMAVSFNPGDTSDNKQLCELDLKTGLRRSLGKIPDGKACFYFFLDDMGRVWISMWGGNGSLYCYDPRIHTIKEYENAFPDPKYFDAEISDNEPQSKSPAWTWLQSIDGGSKCLFTMGSTGGGDERLWLFDPHKDIASKEVFKPLCFIGNTFLSVAKGGGRLYFAQRGDNASSRNYSTELNRDKPADNRGYHINDIHLKSVSIDPDDKYKIIDHGLLIDKEGRTAAHIDAIAADDKGNVYMSGSWLIKNNDPPTLQYIFKASDGKAYGALENPDKQVAGGGNEIINADKDFIPMKRGEFFSRVNVKQDF